MEQLESQISKLQTKFNLLSAWLQLKFPGDATFPCSVVTASKECSDSDFLFKSETQDSSFRRDERLTFADTDSRNETLEELAYDDASTLHAVVKLTPCFVPLVRLNPEDPFASSDFKYYLNSPEHFLETEEIDRPRLSNKGRKHKSTADAKQRAKEKGKINSRTSRSLDCKQNQSKESYDTLEVTIQHIKKQNRVKWSLCCPFCEQQCMRPYIFQHIRSLHPHLMTSEKFRNFEKLLKVRRKRNLPFTKTVLPKKTPYSCPVCRRESGQFYGYQFHIKTCHPDVFEEKVKSGEFPPNGSEGRKVNSTKCDICYKMVRTSKLDNHIALHQDPLLCSQCGYTTSKKANMNCHMKKHSEGKEYKCNLCPFASKQTQGVRAHFKRVHDSAQLMKQCSLCGNLYKGKAGLEKHIAQVHYNERRYQCPLCDKAFKKSTHLNYHLTTHQNPNARKRSLNKIREVQRDRKGSMFFKMNSIPEIEDKCDVQSENRDEAPVPVLLTDKVNSFFTISESELQLLSTPDS